MRDNNYDSRKGTFPPPCTVHAWQPVSFQFELQSITGSSIDRMPDPKSARVYVVCMQCHRHTYIETQWAGYLLVRPSDQHAHDPHAQKAVAPSYYNKYPPKTDPPKTNTPHYSYKYDPETDTYIIPSHTMQRMIYRIGSPKEKIAAEDALENEKRRARARGELREKIVVVDAAPEEPMS